MQQSKYVCICDLDQDTQTKVVLWLYTICMMPWSNFRYLKILQVNYKFVEAKIPHNGDLQDPWTKVVQNKHAKSLKGSTHFTESRGILFTKSGRVKTNFIIKMA